MSVVPVDEPPGVTRTEAEAGGLLAQAGAGARSAFRRPVEASGACNDFAPFQT